MARRSTSLGVLAYRGVERVATPWVFTAKPAITLGPMTPASIVIGVMAHNEAGNVGRLLERLRSVELPGTAIRIVVVASGCTDATVAVARRAAAAEPRVTVVVDPERRGKAVAINQFIT